MKEVVITGVTEGSVTKVDVNREFETVLYTGTGADKTIEMTNIKNGVDMLVVVPTRELAMQVSDELFRFGKFFG